MLITNVLTLALFHVKIILNIIAEYLSLFKYSA